MNRIIFLLLIGIASSCSTPSGEDQMLFLLEKERKEFFNHRNKFASEANLRYSDSLLKAIPGTLPPSLLLLKCNALLELGRTMEAIEILEELSSKYNTKDNASSASVREKLALAYLRLGEQNNCISNHSSESCIFPIRGKGIHTDLLGSTKAISLYEALLKNNPDDLESRWLLNIAYMTLGKYADNADHPFLIPDLNSNDSSYSIKPLVDIANDLKLAVRNMAGGAIIEDFNNDGYLDIVTSSSDLEEHMHYFRNNANGSFTDVSEESGLKKFTGGLNIMQTDYNNDGHKDIFVTRGGWYQEFGAQPNSLLRNNGDGTFNDVTIEAGLLSFHPTQAATWNDFNKDGWLDVFIGNETDVSSMSNPHPCELYINNQDGTFTDVAHKSRCNFKAYVKGVTSGDYDNDGWTDIFLSTSGGRKILLKNKGLQNGTVFFEDVTKKALLDIDNRTFPSWFWDYDNDGWLDIFVCDYTSQKSLAYYAAAYSLNIPNKHIGQPMVFRNNRNGTFSNVTEELGLLKPAYAMGANFGDINNDGFLDMFLGTGNPNYRSLVPNKMFLNLEGKKFADVTTAAKVGNLQKGHGVAFGDMDNDGDQDIYIDMGGAYIGDAYPSSFYLNPEQNNNSWIGILLEGEQSNKCAIGSRIKITFKENGKTRSVYRDVNSGGSFGASTLRREIGLGKATVIEELVVYWHGSGSTQKFHNITPNQFIKIKEGKSSIEKIHLEKLSFKTGNGHGHCHKDAR